MKRLLTFLLAAMVAGCGYSTRSLLPDNYRTIYVEPFENKVDFLDQAQRELYRPNLESQVRTAIVNRYQYDGNLRVADKDTTDLILSGKLIRFEREELRLTQNDNVKEYRIRVTVELTLTDPVEKSVVWTEPAFAGESTYFTSGPQAKSEDQAINDANDDLARRVVARTIENW